MKIIVIGAGIIGATSAYWLGDAGHEVTILEAGDAPGEGTSAGNGGQLAYAYVEPMAGPEIWNMLPAILLGRSDAVRLKPKLDLQFLGWCVRFLANCRRRAMDAALGDLLALSKESAAALEWLLSREVLEFSHRKAGKLIIYGDAASLDGAARLAEAKRSNGIAIEVLDEKAARTLEPALDHYRAEIAGAVHAPGDGVGDCALFTRALVKAAASRHGTRIRTGVAVTGFLRHGRGLTGVATAQGEFQADVVVLAAGLDSPLLARPVGIDLPLYPVKGYSLTAPAGRHAPEVSLTDRSARLLIARLGENVRAAGLADLDGWHDQPDRARIEGMRAQVQRLFPEAADWDRAQPVWMGRRPMTPDGRPLVGPSPVPGLFLNVGHGGLGWTLACGSARRLARVIGPA